MTSAIEKAQPKAVATAEPSSKELAELQAVISQGGVELNPAQVKISWLYAQKRGLDIISRQLIPTVIRGKLTFITTIDGFRVIAERSGDYAGQDPIKFEVSKTSGRLEWAEATVYRHSWGDRGLTVRAYWDEFVPDGKGDYMWKKMPHVMLGKVAEAQALRKAFPNDMSGMYSDDEMAQADQKPQSQRDRMLGELAEATRQAQDDDAEGAVVEEEEEHTRPLRRRKGTTDEQWQAKLETRPFDALTETQQNWLRKRQQPEPVEGDEVHPAEEAAVAAAKQVGDPESGDDYEAVAEPFPELPDSPPEHVEEEEAKATPPDIAAELPIMQGDEGAMFEAEGAIVNDADTMTTAKGNEVFVCWVVTPDKQARVECVMAAGIARSSGAIGVARGLVVDVKGTWTNVGDRLVVLALHIRS